MGIFRRVSENHEGSIYSRLSPAADFPVIHPLLEKIEPDRFANTYYSEEDLTSDLIAFYRALDSANNSKEAAQQTLAPICGFPTDTNERIQWSLKVFDAYPDYQTITTWESPRFVSLPCVDEKCGPVTNRAWPFELSTIQPIEEGDIWDVVRRMGHP